MADYWRDRISQFNSQTKRRTRRVWLFSDSSKVPPDDLLLKMELQDYKCAYCKTPISLFNCTIDHVVPLSHGGEHYLYNLALACYLCNTIKNQTSLKTFCKKMNLDYEAIQQEMADINHRLHILVFSEGQSDHARS